MAEQIIKEKIEHYKNCYLPETDMTFGLLVAVLQGLLMDVQSLESTARNEK